MKLVGSFMIKGKNEGPNTPPGESPGLDELTGVVCVVCVCVCVSCVVCVVVSPIVHPAHSVAGRPS